MNLNKNNYNNFLSKVIFPITFIYPFVLSFGVCSQNGALWAYIATVIISIFIDKFDKRNLLPILLNFTIITFIVNSFGYLSAVVSLFVSGLIISIGNKFYKLISQFKNSSLISGLMFGTALVVTVLQTTNYFGIGAIGNTANEMIKSYVSLGFHGNWRGVLYGTIVMVIMITFPRKFKRFSKIVHASFISLTVSLVLNLFLNPSDMITSINEISNFKINETFNLNITLSGLILSVIFGIVIAFSNLLIISNENFEKSDYIKSGILNIILSPLLCFVPQKISKKVLQNIPFAVLTALVLFLFRDLIVRIPVHSCAVVLIVSAWQSVDWKKIKYAFKTPVSVILFLIPIVLLFIF